MLSRIISETAVPSFRLFRLRLVEVADLHLRILPELYGDVDVVQHLADTAMRGGSKAVGPGR